MLQRQITNTGSDVNRKVDLYGRPGMRAEKQGNLWEVSAIARQEVKSLCIEKGTSESSVQEKEM